jgi:CPA1 family monovalent cation:H+ antiporter
VLIQPSKFRLNNEKDIFVKITFMELYYTFSVLIVLASFFAYLNLTVLVWGGIRGGVSIALVLSLPDGEYKNLLLEITYIVVLFSIVVQGLTVGKVANKVLEKE